MAQERLAFDVELKFAETDGTAVGQINGYGSVFGILDRGGDVVMPGAFKKSLAGWRKRKQLPAMLWQHDDRLPIGVWSSIEEDERGLKVAGQLVMEVPQAKIAYALVQVGAVRGFSIGYKTIDYEIDRGTGMRRLKEVELYEVSLVTIPMLPEAQVSGLKTDFDARALERALRAEGFSESEAKRAVAVARKMDLRDGGQTEHPSRDGKGELLMSLRKTAEALRA